MPPRYITLISTDPFPPDRLRTLISELVVTGPYDSLTIPDTKDLTTLNIPANHFPAKTPQGKAWLQYIADEMIAQETNITKDLRVFLDTFSDKQLAKEDKNTIYVPKEKRATRILTPGTTYVEEYPTRSYKETLTELTNLNKYWIYTDTGNMITQWYDIMVAIASRSPAHLTILKCNPPPDIAIAEWQRSYRQAPSQPKVADVW